MARLFGTDGIRGVANDSITCELAYKLGQAVVLFLGSHILVGRDTRVSGEMLESALSAGIMSMGGTVLQAGVLPTPGVALLVREFECSGGVVISASHNPPVYNGLKVFDSFGYKLPDEKEDEIEAFIKSGGIKAHPSGSGSSEGSDLSVGGAKNIKLAAGDATGKLKRANGAHQIYIDHAVSAIKSQGVSFDGLHVALDCGYGASATTSISALKELGAKVSCIHDALDGEKINVGCGSTNLEPLRKFMSECGADVGVAHDGDADRVMLIDSKGEQIDGDTIGAVLAIDMKSRGRLAKNAFVGTVMCNLGFMHAMRDAGIDVVQTKVGDRYVLEEMRAHGYNLGGEQSGHIIMLDHNTTGDGLMSAVQFISAVLRSGKSFEEAAHTFKKFPQVLINVSDVDKHALDECESVWEAVHEVESDLGDLGRVLLRPSGTEPYVRVMVEASSEKTAQNYAEKIADVVKKHLAL